MNDTPGRTSPGTSPSDEHEPTVPEESAPTDGTPGTDEAARSSQWARQQPPGGRWSTPAAGPPPPRRPPRQRAHSGQGADGAGQGGGWGARGAWTAPPAAPQPGVIPLRPLAVGELIEGTLHTVRRNWRPVFGISLALALGTQAVATAVAGLWFRDVASLDPADAEDAEALLRNIGENLGGTTAAWFLSLLGSIVATALLTVIVSRAVLGRTTTVGEAWRNARPRLARMCGLMVMLPLLIAAVFAVGTGPGLLLANSGSPDLESSGVALTALGGLAAAVAGTWLWIRYCLAAPALMLEKQGVLASMRRSAKLVRGAWWRIFGVQLLALVLTFTISMLAQIPVSVVEAFLGADVAATGRLGWTELVVAGIGATIGSAVTFPLTASMTALLYMDQRIRRESLDLELARAAGE
ncbi:hypothetical protein [Streptomyces albireticuli]|uniref:DUF7847 domain-containing protein n=1 Tax=Streptomyces albireticuli TaxID=1940 RepID=A0A2A2DDC9_9ACTN|nr:hypothetical protein [Streptomyces albireticuli]MCD9165988.1 hypothetical protein [Streptomyces albireticuli]MCD9196140.1 hypothetical protein [Streptomyces albireticuli]PAU49446.1 hypothetical protein CK936_07740 [Streptomyces albireticuli]